MKITLDKIASSTARLELPREVELTPHIESKEGNVIAVRALMEKSVYDRLELTSGRMAKINRGTSSRARSDSAARSRASSASCRTRFTSATRSTS